MMILAQPSTGLSRQKNYFNTCNAMKKKRLDVPFTCWEKKQDAGGSQQSFLLKDLIKNKRMRMKTHQSFLRKDLKGHSTTSTFLGVGRKREFGSS